MRHSISVHQLASQMSTTQVFNFETSIRVMKLKTTKIIFFWSLWGLHENCVPQKLPAVRYEWKREWELAQEWEWEWGQILHIYWYSYMITLPLWPVSFYAQHAVQTEDCFLSADLLAAQNSWCEPLHTGTNVQDYNIYIIDDMRTAQPPSMRTYPDVYIVG